MCLCKLLCSRGSLPPPGSFTHPRLLGLRQYGRSSFIAVQYDNNKLGSENDTVDARQCERFSPPGGDRSPLHTHIHYDDVPVSVREVGFPLTRNADPRVHIGGAHTRCGTTSCSAESVGRTVERSAHRSVGQAIGVGLAALGCGAGVFRLTGRSASTGRPPGWLARRARRCLIILSLSRERERERKSCCTRSRPRCDDTLIYHLRGGGGRPPQSFLHARTVWWVND